MSAPWDIRIRGGVPTYCGRLYHYNDDFTFLSRYRSNSHIRYLISSSVHYHTVPVSRGTYSRSWISHSANTYTCVYPAFSSRVPLACRSYPRERLLAKAAGLSVPISLDCHWLTPVPSLPLRRTTVPCSRISVRYYLNMYM